MEPVSDVVRAVVFPFKALFVVGLCFVINLVTSPGHWWFLWVALGMGIALLRVWMRAFGTLAVGAALATAAYGIHRWWTRRGKTSRDDVIDVPSRG